jgi:predicted RNA binding protein YcfA (HicA-like mRNA interferase family)
LDFEGAPVKIAMKPRKLFLKALNRPKNLPFHDFLQLAQAFGFRLARMNGSHHIMIHEDVPQPLNLQEVDGKAKPYQVRQFLRIIEENNLNLGDEL